MSARVGRESAVRVAARSRVRIRGLTSVADSFAAERLFRDVWQTGPGEVPIAADVVRALADADNYVAGAFEAGPDEGLLGAAIGFWGPPGQPRMHSHILGVSTAARGRDIGYVVKLDQRAHALERDVTTITWTFDPLVARNAHFNLHKLGGTADTYLPDHYGRLVDGLNGDDPSDRLMLRWDLLSDRARQACDGDAPLARSSPPAAVLIADGDLPRHRESDADRVLVAVPADIEGLRRRAPESAGAWRSAVREVLGGLLAAGARIVDFDRAACGYVVEHRQAS
jgi:predicted GNAT superfamily acetyltransferase